MLLRLLLLGLSVAAQHFYYYQHPHQQAVAQYWPQDQLQQHTPVHLAILPSPAPQPPPPAPPPPVVPVQHRATHRVSNFVDRSRPVLPQQRRIPPPPARFLPPLRFIPSPSQTITSSPRVIYEQDQPTWSPRPSRPRQPRPPSLPVRPPQPSRSPPPRPTRPSPTWSTAATTTPTTTTTTTTITVATTRRVVKPGSSKPNDAFLSCCESSSVDKSCYSRCNFDVLTKKVLTAMFLGSDPCPSKNGRGLLACAAQNEDHTECCTGKGVHLTSAGNKCLGFCKLSPGHEFQADASYLPCWAVLNHIKQCFKDYINEH